MNSWHATGKLKTCAVTIGCSYMGNVFPIRCKRWDCETCAQINARLHAVRVANGIYAMAAAGIVPKFVTLTLPGRARKAWAFEKLADMWAQMHDRWHYKASKVGRVTAKEVRIGVDGHYEFMRDGGIPLTFAAFVELQGRGVPHFHIVSNYSPRVEDLRKIAVKSGLGFEVDVENVKSKAGVAWYISKYAGKTQGKMGLPKGFRRVRYSQDWPGMRLRIDDDENDIDKIIKHFDESTDDFIRRAHDIFNIDIREQVTAIIDAVPDGQLMALVEGIR